MLNKLILTTILILSSAISFAGQDVDVSISCVIEGHGGGCQSEGIALNEVPGATSFKATITEDDCYESEECDFCHSTIVSKTESTEVNYLRVNIGNGNSALVLAEGSNEVRVNFYDENGSYITTQFLTVNASVEMTY
jgi:hypothetical protein